MHTLQSMDSEFSRLTTLSNISGLELTWYSWQLQLLKSDRRGRFSKATDISSCDNMDMCRCDSERVKSGIINSDKKPKTNFASKNFFFQQPFNMELKKVEGIGGITLVEKDQIFTITCPSVCLNILFITVVSYCLVYVYFTYSIKLVIMIVYGARLRKYTCPHAELIIIINLLKVL